jgi:hypothetical protein
LAFGNQIALINWNGIPSVSVPTSLQGGKSMRDENERRALAAKYRQLAEEAKEWAAKVPSEVLQEEYLRLAQGWFQMADDVDPDRGNRAGPSTQR